MGLIHELVEDLKVYIHRNEVGNLDIDINRRLDSGLEKDESAFSRGYVRQNLSGIFEPLGKGTTRHVYRINTNKYGSKYNRKVIKFATSPCKRVYNKREIRTWMAVKSLDIRSYFSRIRMFDASNS